MGVVRRGAETDVQACHEHRGRSEIERMSREWKGVAGAMWFESLLCCCHIDTLMQQTLESAAIDSLSQGLSTLIWQLLTQRNMQALLKRSWLHSNIASVLLTKHRGLNNHSSMHHKDISPHPSSARLKSAHRSHPSAPQSHSSQAHCRARRRR